MEESGVFTKTSLMLANWRIHTNTHRNTHRVVFFDMATDVEQQFVAEVDGVVDGAAPTGDVTASHQAGLQLRSLNERI